jgi:hypothetical protein
MAWDKIRVVFSKILVCSGYVKCLQPKSDKYIFVGYPKVTIGYSSRTPKTKVFVAENVKFLEKEIFAKVKWEDNRTLIGLLNLSYMC